MRGKAPKALEKGVTLLEASAGTGKTHSITALVLRLVVEHGLTVDRILVVTFTEAATAELRERIRVRLREALAALQPGATPDEETAAILGRAKEPRIRLERALAAFDEAAISTIHGFCRRVLQENAFESGADFEAELVTEADDLLREVVEDFWVRELHDADPLFVRHLARRRIDPGKLVELAKKAGADLEVVPAAGAPELPEGWAAAYDSAKRSWTSEREGVLAAVRAATGLYARHPFAEAGQLERCAAALDLFFAGEPLADLPDALGCFGQAKFTDQTKKGHRVPRHGFFDCCDALVAADALRAAALDERALALEHRLVAFAREQLPARKRAAQVRAFDDLLALVRDALDSPALVAAVRARYDAALIDEFQDTDPVQWAIFRRLFGDGARWLYLIGDPKQAIYAFRGADIFTYLDAKTSAGRELDLARNYRSDGRLVAAVNLLFGRRPGAFLYEGIPFRPVEAEHAADRLVFADGPRAPLSFRLVLPPDPQKAFTKGDLEDQLPSLVAGEIAEFLNSGATLADGRRVAPGDVAVLVRRNRQAREVQAALRARGIPAVIQGGESVFATHEAMELERLLRALVHPTEVRRVRAALATDLLGLDAAGVAALEADESAWEAWLDRLREWRRAWIEQGFMRAFRAVLTDLRLPERLLSWADGERRLTNLLHLAELVHAAAVQERLEPAALMRWLAQQRRDPAPEQETRRLRLETDADAVEVATVHGSKGLQYGVVWCPYLWDGARRPDDEHLRCHDGEKAILDIALDGADPDKRAHAEAALHETQAEDLRLLYVALTRARHRCVVHWSLVNEGGSSPLAWLLHGQADLASTAVRYRGWRGNPAALQAEMAALVAESGGVIACDEARATGERYQAPEVAPAALRTSVFLRPKPLDSLWRRASFSQMVRAEITPEDDVRDHDADPVVPEVPVAEGEIIPLALMPGGNRVGTAIHKMLEEHDFTERDPAVLRARVSRVMKQHGLDGEPWVETLATGIEAMLDTPFSPEGWRLRDLTAADRLNEMAFDFPVVGRRGLVLRDALLDVLREHRTDAVGSLERLERLRFPPLRGFLTGNIDLVFRRGGRWYVVDYKTNFLGERTGHYAAARLPAAMAAHHYHLQYHLYAVALHRWLRWRQPGYDAARHFGGVYYLFMRGMDPAAGPSRGVFADRPTPAMLEALSALVS